MRAVGAEGTIAVRLRARAGRIVGVGIDNGRPAQPGRIFVGRSFADVPAMLPLLFSLCGTAQLVAGLRAIEDAADIAAAPPHLSARSLLLAAETVLEHGQRILRDWPELLDEPGDLVAVKGLRAALVPLRGLIYPNKEWARLGGGVLAPDLTAARRCLSQARSILHRHVFAGPSAIPLADRSALVDWARIGATPAGRVVGRLFGELASWGASDVPLLPTLAVGQLAARLASDDANTFVARPEWEGSARLTHPLSRCSSQPIVAALLADYGNGALALAAARLVELQQALDEADVLAATLEPHPGATDIAYRDGTGLGKVEAARGLLVHRVELVEGRVARYQMLAPTEWNFHPDGALAGGLRLARDEPGLPWRARLLAMLIDPCVEVSVSLEHE